MEDDFKRFRDRMLEDPATRAAYDARKPAYAFALQLAELRRQRGFSQASLAKRAGMTPVRSRQDRSRRSITNLRHDGAAAISGRCGSRYPVQGRDGQNGETANGTQGCRARPAVQAWTRTRRWN